MPANIELTRGAMQRLLQTIDAKLGRLVEDRGARALRSVGELWMTEAKKRTPVDTGALRASGHVTGPEPEGMDWVVRLRFGGPAAPYAYIVHENLRARHKVGQSKYLESVIVERGSQLDTEIARQLR